MLLSRPHRLTAHRCIPSLISTRETPFPGADVTPNSPTAHASTRSSSAWLSSSGSIPHRARAATTIAPCSAPAPAEPYCKRKRLTRARARRSRRRIPAGEPRRHSPGRTEGARHPPKTLRPSVPRGANARRGLAAAPPWSALLLRPRRGFPACVQVDLGRKMHDIRATVQTAVSGARLARSSPKPPLAAGLQLHTPQNPHRRSLPPPHTAADVPTSSWARAHAPGRPCIGGTPQSAPCTFLLWCPGT